MIHSKQRKSPGRNMALAALLLALAFVLPLLTGQIPQIGMMLSPMHIPAMLAGFILPLPWAVALAFVMPLLRSLLFSIPIMLPMALTMAFELAAYALIISWLAPKLAQTLPGIIATLLIAMAGGRVVYAIANYFILNAMGIPFNLATVFKALTIGGLPGIIIQLLLLPPLVLALRRAGMRSPERA